MIQNTTPSAMQVVRIAPSHDVWAEVDAWIAAADPMAVVTTVAATDEAAARLRNERWDVLLLDWTTPDRVDPEILELVKADSVILLFDERTQPAVTEALGRDADGCTFYPVSVDAVGMVTATLGRLAAMRRRREKWRSRRNRLARRETRSIVTEIAAQLGHDLNQPLGVISNYAHVCTHQLRASTPEALDEALDSLKEILEQIDRAAGVVQQLRKHVGRPNLERSAVDLADMIQDVAELLQPDLRTGQVRLQLLLDNGPLRVMIDRDGIEQVLVLLARNAIEAMQDIPPKNRQLTISANNGIEDRVEISLRDTGQGLHADRVRRAFEPFFSTRPDGLGIGLNVGRRIIDAHGGQLDAVTNGSPGSTFRFTLPIDQEHKTKPTRCPRETRQPRVSHPLGTDNHIKKG